MNRLFIATVAGVLLACGDDTSTSTSPRWPVEIRLRLVNDSNITVFVMAAGDESLYPGVAHLAPGDSACTSVYAFADSVPVEVHPLGNPNVIVGVAWIHPQDGLGWHAVVQGGGVTMSRSAACSY